MSGYHKVNGTIPPGHRLAEQSMQMLLEFEDKRGHVPTSGVTRFAGIPAPQPDASRRDLRLGVLPLRK